MSHCLKQLRQLYGRLSISAAVPGARKSLNTCNEFASLPVLTLRTTYFGRTAIRGLHTQNAVVALRTGCTARRHKLHGQTLFTRVDEAPLTAAFLKIAILSDAPVCARSGVIEFHQHVNREKYFSWTYSAYNGNAPYHH